MSILPIMAQKVNFYFIAYCLAEEASPLLETITRFDSYKTVYFDLEKGTVDYPTSKDRRCCTCIEDKIGVLIDKTGKPSLMAITTGGNNVISLDNNMGTFCQYNEMFLLGSDDIVKGYKFEDNLIKLIKLLKQYGYKIHYSKESN